jgi:hypothetical protein
MPVREPAAAHNPAAFLASGGCPEKSRSMLVLHGALHATGRFGCHARPCIPGSPAVAFVDRHHCSQGRGGVHCQARTLYEEAAMYGKLPILFLAGCLAVLASGRAQAENAERGQALYETQCIFCHESQVHLRAGHNVTNLADLQRRVQAWSWHAALGWSNEEIADVVGYLNQRFYHFPQPVAH